MDTYIVRIYRHDPEDPRSLVGLVEEVGIDEKRPFKNLGELQDVLIHAIRRKSRTKDKKKRSNNIEREGKS